MPFPTADNCTVTELASQDVTIDPQNPRAIVAYWVRRDPTRGDAPLEWAEVNLAIVRQDAPRPGTVRVPLAYRGLPRTNVEYKQEAATLWTVTVTYGYAEPAGGFLGLPIPAPDLPPGVAPPSAPSPPNDFENEYALLGREWSFDTTGGTSTQRVSRGTRVGVTVPTNPNGVPDFERAMNVGPEGIQGTEIVTRKLELAISRTVPGVTGAWLRKAYRLTGCINDAPYLGFAGDKDGVSELLFLGVTGQGRDDGAWTVTWRFLASPNRSESLILDTPKATIGGHDFVWYVFGQGTSNGFPVMTPLHAYVERVYEAGDFRHLGIFGEVGDPKRLPFGNGQPDPIPGPP